jgi:leukotriene-A4 hydrolase
VWNNTYTVLVLPPSFPHGGMENPYLTFVSPSIILGDRSSANVVAHEIVHSWFGNLLTCANWSHTWLNEGFTVYGERRIMQVMYGTEFYEAHALRGYEDLVHSFDSLENDPEFTKLQPTMKRVSPDDPFTTVPYEKGFAFLKYLEGLTGLDNFLGMLRAYLSAYHYKSVTREDFQEHFIHYVQVSLAYY